MDSDKLNDRIQIIGIFLVVASLVFVGLQMKQTHEIALAGQYQERSAMAIDYWNGIVQNEFYVRNIGNRFIEQLGPLDSVFSEMTAEEFGSLYVYARMTLATLDNHHFQYQAGFYDEDTWQGFRAQLQGYVSSDRMARLLLQKRGDFFRAEFRRLCEELIAETVPSGDGKM